MTDTIVQLVVSKHADEVPILLHMRNRFLRSASTYPSDLRALDKRLAANLEGLAIAGEEGWRAAVALFEDRPEPATVTAIANLAYFHENDLYLTYLRNALANDHLLIEMAAFGLSWLGPKRVKKIIQSHWAGENDTDTATALACSLIYDLQPCSHDIDAFFTRNKLVHLWAIKVAGWYNLQSVLPYIIATKTENDPLMATACDTALVLLRHDHTAIYRILNSPKNNPYHKQKLFEIALLGLDPDERVQWWHKQDDPDLRLRAAYIISDRRCVPWLLEQCEEGAYADEAIECIHQITSFDVENMISESVSEEIANPFAVAPKTPQNPVENLSTWWRSAGEKIPDGPVFLASPFDQISLKDEVKTVSLSVRQTLALHHRLKLKTVDLPIGQSPNLQDFKT